MSERRLSPERNHRLAGRSCCCQEATTAGIERRTVATAGRYRIDGCTMRNLTAVSTFCVVAMLIIVASGLSRAVSPRERAFLEKHE
jgi:hypothetical protein